MAKKKPKRPKNQRPLKGHTMSDARLLRSAEMELARAQKRGRMPREGGEARPGAGALT